MISKIEFLKKILFFNKVDKFYIFIIENLYFKYLKKLKNYLIS